MDRAPKDLHGMLSADESILKLIDNYHLHLIVPAEIEDNDFGKLHNSTLHTPHSNKVRQNNQRNLTFSACQR